MNKPPTRILVLAFPQWPADSVPDLDVRRTRALLDMIPGWRVINHQSFAIALRGATRFYGSEPAVVAALHTGLQQELPDPVRNVQIGIADTLGAARIFAAGAQPGAGAQISPPGATPTELAKVPIEALGLLSADAEAIIAMSQRLGINTLGQFAALDTAALIARFGPASIALQQTSKGTDTNSYAGLSPLATANDHSVRVTFEPELTLPEQVAFSCAESAEALVTGLFADHLVCTAVTITTVGRHTTTKQWRHASWFRPRDIIDRIRWQLAHHSAATSTDDLDPELQSARESISAVVIVPSQTEDINHHQPGLLGGHDDGALQDTIARLQSLHQYDAVLSPSLVGGRLLGTRTRLTPFGQHPAAAPAVQLPWPGHLPGAALPASAPPTPTICNLQDGSSTPITITARGELSGVPTHWINHDKAEHIHTWWGPWELYENWWDDVPVRYRIQIVTDSGTAALLLYSLGDWFVEGMYS